MSNGNETPCRTCENCGKRKWNSWSGVEYCMWYEMTDDPVAEASDCPSYFYEETPEEEEYCPSSSNRDYGPSNPWDAPGMSIRDFI